MTKEDIEKYQILRLVTGSHAYGLNTPTSDRDEKAIVIEPIEEVAGLGEPWGGKVYSQAGTEDFEVYGLRKFLRLALKGNPTVTEMLFIKGGVRDARGSKLQELYPHIISRQAGIAYLGYMRAQYLRLIGERGNGGHGQPRQDLIDKYGFDTKFAMHMLRLGLQGIELLSTGRLELPLTGDNLRYLQSVRSGTVPLEDCIRRYEEVEAELKELLLESKLPDEPNREVVEKWMTEMYFYNWSARRPSGGAGSFIGQDMIDHAQRAGYDIILKELDQRLVSVQINAKQPI